MSTIRAIFPVAIRTKLVIDRDFYLGVEYQLAKALYDGLMELNEADAVDFLLQNMVLEGKGEPYIGSKALTTPAVDDEGK